MWLLIEEIFSTCSRYRGHVPFIFDHSSHHCLCVRILFCLGECMYHILGCVQLEALCAFKKMIYQKKKDFFLVHLMESQEKSVLCSITGATMSPSGGVFKSQKVVSLSFFMLSM